MSYNIRIPKMTAKNPTEQIRQLHSYLYQVVEQLNWVLNDIETPSNAETNGSSAVGSNALTSQEDASANTFNSIKGLIIKSADIVTAYYEEIDNLLKLSGEYVAEATFPDGSAAFVEQTNMKVNANSNSIEQFYKDVQTINANLASVTDKLQKIDVTANIKSGLLDYDDSGVPIYGLEVGQRTEVNGVETFNRYARFTANKLSFYDQNDIEVAYISDNKLYIKNLQVTVSFIEGGYKDIIDASGGIVTKWVGVGGD